MGKTHFALFGFVSLLIITLTTIANANSSPLKEYTLGSGDKIEIKVFGEEDLSVTTHISDSGSISYPLLGEISVRGKTLGEVESLITKKLTGDILVDPKVNITILEYRQFFVNGEVAKPGGYPFLPGLTIRKAISLAGGFTDRAAEEEISVIHDFAANQKPQPVSLDSTVYPGDIITVKESFF
ncbi:polysaccharide biosynthesis/export family protein [Magnetococcales bacterium HHB-1]